MTDIERVEQLNLFFKMFDCLDVVASIREGHVRPYKITFMLFGILAYHSYSNVEELERRAQDFLKPPKA